MFEQRRAAMRRLSGGDTKSLKRLAPLSSGRRVRRTDPDAPEQLEGRLAAARTRHAAMVRANALLRAGVIDELDQLGLAQEDLRRLQVGRAGTTGFNDQEIRNAAAAVYRTKQRLRELAQLHAQEHVFVEGAGFTYAEDVDALRAVFSFAAKPNAETRDLLRRFGFRPSLSGAGVYARPLNDPARAAAREVLAMLDEPESVDTCPHPQSVLATR